MREFYGCYLLLSKNEKAKGRTYIGFTVNPRRRIRQHNGEITSGAHRTKSYRPWEMVLVVYGFATKVQALQFEWAWQHPTASKLVREVAQQIGKRAMLGCKGKVRLLHEMLNVAPWCFYPLTVQFLSSELCSLRQKCPNLPSHMTLTVAPLEALPVAVDDEEQADSSSDGAESEFPESASAEGLEEELVRQKGFKPLGGYKVCVLCEQPLTGHWLACACGSQTHPDCLAHHYLENGEEGATIPVSGRCPACGKEGSWLDALKSGDNIGWRRPTSRVRRSKTSKSKTSKSVASDEGTPRKRRGRPKKIASRAVSSADESQGKELPEVGKPKRKSRAKKAAGPLSPSGKGARIDKKPAAVSKPKRGTAKGCAAASESACQASASATGKQKSEEQQPGSLSSALEVPDLPKSAEGIDAQIREPAEESWSMSDSDPQTEASRGRCQEATETGASCVVQPAAPTRLRHGTCENLTDDGGALGINARLQTCITMLATRVTAVPAVASRGEESGDDVAIVGSPDTCLGDERRRCGDVEAGMSSADEAHQATAFERAEEQGFRSPRQLGLLGTAIDDLTLASAKKLENRPPESPRQSTALRDRDQNLTTAAVRPKRIRSVHKQALKPVIDLTDSPAAQHTPQHLPLRRRLDLLGRQRHQVEESINAGELDDQVIILT